MKGFEPSNARVVGAGDPADWLYIVTNGAVVMRAVPSREDPEKRRDVVLGQYKVIGMRPVLTPPEKGGGQYHCDCFTQQARAPPCRRHNPYGVAPPHRTD